MVLRCVLFGFLLLFGVAGAVQAKPVSDFLPTQQQYLANVPSPEQVLGFELGQRHPHHYQILNYFKQLAVSSKRIKITEIGQTYQHRKQILVTISDEKNLAKLDEIIAKRKSPAVKRTNEPLVIWLGYSVHGDELTGANAAMAVAYYLAASQSPEVKAILAETVIVIEPSLNPDGLDRYVSWLETFRGSTANADGAHMEHYQSWPSARTNHFWFDLNRDWLLLSQQESRNRLKYFHLYQPHVVADYHEMDTDQSYFFQPGVASRVHPLTPQSNIELTHKLAKYHAKTLDQHQRLYFSQESYDDFFFGKGSTYPDINGGIGILFEQASSKGLMHDSVNGVLTFEYGIENHVLTSLSTIKGAWENRQNLKDHQINFYQQSLNLAKDEKYDGYLLYEENDSYRLAALLNILQQHQIEFYALNADFEHEDKIFHKEYAYYVPFAQPQYRMIKALFNQQKDFEDNSFYDISGWTLPLAMNIEFHQIDKSRHLKLSQVKSQAEVNQLNTPMVNQLPLKTNDKTLNKQENYAYAFQWSEYLAPKLLNQLLTRNIKVKAATQSFTSLIDGKTKTFQQGTIIIPAALQTDDDWQNIVFKAANESALQLFTISSGLTLTGPNIGSQAMVNIDPVKVLLIGGQGVAEYEAGEVLYYLDHVLNIPVTVVEKSRLPKLNLSLYSHILMVDGDYQAFDEPVINKFQNFAIAGGVIFAQKEAAQWLADNRLLKARFATQNSIDSMFIDYNDKYQDKSFIAAQKKIAGAIFDGELDLSHPLTFGFTNHNVPFFRNSTLIMEKVNVPFAQVARYSNKPLLSGFTDQFLIERLTNQAIIVAHNLGEGRVIATTEHLLFRGYWLGTSKILANSLFFAKAFNTPQ